MEVVIQIFIKKILKFPHDILKDNHQMFQNSLHARVVLINDTYCAGSCLTFMDEVYALDATLHFPIKVFRNRRRKPNELNCLILLIVAMVSFFDILVH